jgi:hypothetical protein
MIILSTQERKYETKTFNERKFEPAVYLPFPETWSLNSLLTKLRLVGMQLPDKYKEKFDAGFERMPYSIQ